MSILTEAFKELKELDDLDFDLEDDEDVDKAQKFLDSEDDTENIEMIVDIDAEDEEDLKDTYVGELLLYCPVCHTIHYAKEEEINKGEDEDVVNVGEACPHCKQDSEGFEIKGKVAEYKENEEDDKEDTQEPEGDNEDEDKPLENEEDIKAGEEETELEFDGKESLHEDLDEEDDLSQLQAFIGDDIVDYDFKDEEIEDTTNLKESLVSPIKRLVEAEEDEDSYDAEGNYTKDACYYLNTEGAFDVDSLNTSKKVDRILKAWPEYVKSQVEGKGKIWGVGYDKEKKAPKELVVKDIDGGKRIEVKNDSPSDHEYEFIIHLGKTPNVEDFDVSKGKEEGIFSDYVEAVNYLEELTPEDFGENRFALISTLEDGDYSEEYDIYKLNKKGGKATRLPRKKVDDGLGEGLKDGSCNKKLKEQVQEEAYAIADYIDDHIKDRDTITRDEYEEQFALACRELYGIDNVWEIEKDGTIEINGKTFDANELLEGDVRGILGYKGWATEYEGENEGGLTQLEEGLKEAKLQEKPVYGLNPQHDSRKSFYGKAQVDTGDKGDQNKLYSYDTLVAEIKDGKPVVYGTYSATTLRHIKEWLKQLGFKAETSKQIMADYGVKEESCNEEKELQEKIQDTYQSGNVVATTEVRHTPYKTYQYVNLTIDGKTYRGSSSYINRPWETFDKQRALMKACREAGVYSDELENLRSFQEVIDTLAKNRSKKEESCKEGLNESNDINKAVDWFINSVKQENGSLDALKGSVEDVKSAIFGDKSDEEIIDDLEYGKNIYIPGELNKSLKKYDLSSTNADAFLKKAIEIANSKSTKEGLGSAITALTKDIPVVNTLLASEEGEKKAPELGVHRDEECKDEECKKHDNLEESLKVIGDFSDYEPWSGAVSTYERIEEEGKLNDLESLLEECYPDGLAPVDINDILWFESDWVFENLGINDGEEDEEEDDFDEGLFESLVNKYCTRVYENVNNFKLLSGKLEGNSIILEGKLTYKSGKEVPSKFIFEKKETKDNRVKYIGLNETFSNSKRAFTLQAKVEGNKVLSESLTYNYQVKVENQNKSLYGRVKNK